MAKIAPSILAANFARLGEQVLETERAGADRVHVDVMDGHFVPNLSMGPIVVKALKPITRMPLEVHLMIEEPGRYVDAFIKAGADSLIVHQEVLPDPRPLLSHVRREGKKVGLAVNPDTPVELIEPYLENLDLALCMTVHPGFGGQSFMSESLPRIRKLRHLINTHNPACELEVDGGIDDRSGPETMEAGATVFVMGTAIFGAPEGAGGAILRLNQFLGR